MVGDSWVDGVAATAAGVPFVAYRPNEADLTRWKLEPVARLDDLAALPAWLAAARRRATLRAELFSFGMELLERRPARQVRRRPAPLADRMRPRTLDEVVGQDHLLGPGTRAARGDRERRAALDDPVGAARLGQDHAGLADGPRGRRPLRRVLGGAVRRQGDPPGRGRGGDRADPPPAGAPSCSSTRSIASTALSRTRSCPTSRRARSS